MGRKRTARAKWFPVCSEDVVRPKSSDNLEVALRFLAPFEFSSSGGCKHALTGIVQKYGRSEELARERIEQAARDYNASAYFRSKAPRFSDLERELDSLADQARSMKEAIASCGFFALMALRKARENGPKWIEFSVKANIEGLPSGLADPSRTNSAWLGQLEAFERFAKATLRKEQNLRATNGRGRRDKGGNTNLWIEYFGSPERNLVSDALALFDHFKPGQATGTDGGLFHQFVLAIYEYATGQEGEDRSTLYRWVKDLVQPSREDRALEQKQCELFEQGFDAMHKLLFQRLLRDVEAPQASPSLISQQEELVRTIHSQLEEAFCRRGELSKRIRPDLRLGTLPA